MRRDAWRGTPRSAVHSRQLARNSCSLPFANGARSGQRRYAVGTSRDGGTQDHCTVTRADSCSGDRGQQAASTARRVLLRRGRAVDRDATSNTDEVARPRAVPGTCTDVGLILLRTRRVCDVETPARADVRLRRHATSGASPSSLESRPGRRAAIARRSIGVPYDCGSWLPSSVDPRAGRSTCSARHTSARRKSRERSPAGRYIAADAGQGDRGQARREAGSPRAPLRADDPEGPRRHGRPLLPQPARLRAPARTAPTSWCSIRRSASTIPTRSAACRCSCSSTTASRSASRAACASSRARPTASPSSRASSRARASSATPRRSTSTCRAACSAASARRPAPRRRS